MEHLSRQIKCAALIQDLGNLTLMTSKGSTKSQYVIDMALIYMGKFLEKAENEKINLVYLAAASLFISNKYFEAGIQMDSLVNKLSELAKMNKCDKNKMVYYIKSLEHLFLALLGTKELVHPIHYIMEISKIYCLDQNILTSFNYICSAILHYSDFSIRSSKEIAIVGLYIALKWHYLELKETKNKHWFQFIIPNIKLEKIKELSHKFLRIYHQIPTKLKVLVFQIKNPEKTAQSSDRVSVTINKSNSANCQRKTITKDEYLKRKPEYLKRIPEYSEKSEIDTKRFKEENDHRELVNSAQKSGDTPENYN